MQLGGGYRDGFRVRGEEDSRDVGVGVLIRVIGELCELDERGVAGVGVSGGDIGNESLGNEEVSACMLSSGPEDKARSVV